MNLKGKSGRNEFWARLLTFCKVVEWGLCDILRFGNIEIGKEDFFFYFRSVEIGRGYCEDK